MKQNEQMKNLHATVIVQLHVVFWILIAAQSQKAFEHRSVFVGYYTIETIPTNRLNACIIAVHST